MNVAVRRPRSSKDSKLNGVQRVSGVSSGHIGKKFQSVRFNDSPVISHSFVTVVYCAQDQLTDIVLAERFQFKNDRPGQKRAVDLEIRILRGRADKNKSTVFHKRQKIILLSFVKTMDLVNKEDCFLAVHAQTIMRFFHNGFHILFTGGSSVDLGKVSACGAGDHPGQSSFACSEHQKITEVSLSAFMAR